MLRIEKLQVVGFKSFHDRTEVQFPTGITAVVGPNGCGKSNIGDAIHWVLGEQSARTLRGEKMEDVIFAGSEARKPMGMAEVTLRLVRAHADGAETVEVARRLYRSGESEYLLDGRRVRLKDVQEVLQQAHVGARTYAVIEQGKVEALLTARPKDRRVLIEDAAGIIGYKQKKRLSELKLEATEANLLRVSDIVAEVTRQIGSLKRQAARARRHRRLLDGMRSLQTALFVREAGRIASALGASRARVAEASDGEALLAAGLAKMEAAVESSREELDRLEQVLAQARDRLHELDLEIDRETNRRIGLLARCEELRGEEARLQQEQDQMGEREKALAVESESWRHQSGQLVEALRLASERRGALEAAHAARAASATGLKDLVESARQEALTTRDRLVESRNERRRVEEDERRHEALLDRLTAEQSAAGLEWERAESAAREARSRREEAESALEGLREAQAAADGARQAAEVDERASANACEEAGRDHATAAERLRALTDAETRFGGRNEGVRWILTRASEEGVRTRGVVADFVRAPIEVERAAEGYLSELLPAVLVEEREDLVRGIEALHREGAGRCVFLAERNGHDGAGPREALPEDLRSQPGVLGTLAEKIQGVAPYNGLITDRFPDAVVVENLARALDLHGQWPERNFVTRDGDVVYASGVVAGGRSTKAGEGLLAQTRAIEAARGQLTEAVARGEGAGARLDAARAALAGRESAAAAALSRKTDAEKDLVALRMNGERAAEEAQRGHRAVELLAGEAERARIERTELAARAGGMARLIEGLEADLAAAEARRETVETEGRLLGESLLASGEELGRLRSEEATLAERRDGVERELTRLDQSAREVRNRIEQGRTAIATARLRQVELTGEAESTSTRIGALHARRSSESRDLDAGQQRASDLRGETVRTEGETRAAREALESVRARRQQAEIDTARLGSDRDHLEERCLQELSKTIAQARQDTGAAFARVAGAAALLQSAQGPDEDENEGLDEPAAGEPGEAPFDPVVCEEQIRLLREKIDSLGPVNMMALEQFSELEDRHKFLTAQKQDLVASIESLRETIRKINRSFREQFVDAFEKIRANFDEIFKLLFGGGRAELRLEESVDPLEAGLEVIAQPPGKRLQNISLLSGGEKSMTAIALLFAIFRYQPSPFCLMDEVDAALDELNIGRFTRMLKEYARDTQFIVVTHNPRSMEAADILYGVTMPEPGISRVVSIKLPEAVAVAAH